MKIQKDWRKRDPLDVVVEFLITYVLGFAVFLVKLSLGLYVLKKLGIS